MRFLSKIFLTAETVINNSPSKRRLLLGGWKYGRKLNHFSIFTFLMLETLYSFLFSSALYYIGAVILLLCISDLSSKEAWFSVILTPLGPLSSATSSIVNDIGGTLGLLSPKSAWSWYMYTFSTWAAHNVAIVLFYINQWYPAIADAIPIPWTQLHTWLGIPLGIFYKYNLYPIWDFFCLLAKGLYYGFDGVSWSQHIWCNAYLGYMKLIFGSISQCYNELYWVWWLGQDPYSFIDIPIYLDEIKWSKDGVHYSGNSPVTEINEQAGPSQSHASLNENSTIVDSEKESPTLSDRSFYFPLPEDVESWRKVENSEYNFVEIKRSVAHLSFQDKMGFMFHSFVYSKGLWFGVSAGTF